MLIFTSEFPSKCFHLRKKCYSLLVYILKNIEKKYSCEKNIIFNKNKILTFGVKTLIFDVKWLTTHVLTYIRNNIKDISNLNIDIVNIILGEHYI